MNSGDVAEALLKSHRHLTLSGLPIQIQGHRGGYQPENTMKAFRLALDRGLDGIEFDVSAIGTYPITGLAH